MTQRKSNSWFEVDKEGLSQLMKEGGAQRAVLELVSNALDEKVTTVSLTIDRSSKTTKTIAIEDDSPSGFVDLTHAYRLFAQSRKKGDETKRGRFNLGEKMVLSLCDNATIISTSGTVTFGLGGREMNKSKKRDRGTLFMCTMTMSDDDMEDALNRARNILVPVGVDYHVNGERVVTPDPVLSFEATLPTVKADDDGNLRTTVRKTTVSLHRVPDGEEAHIFEIGIPVVDVDCKWHINICQKVPLNFNRDNVTPAYLSKVLALVLNHSVDLIDNNDTGEEWVREATASEHVEPEVMQKVLQKTFGDKVAVHDPKDSEASKRLTAQGYTILYGGSLSKGQWANVKQNGLVPSASSIAPTNPEKAENSETIETAKWTNDMLFLARYVNRFAMETINAMVETAFINNPSASVLATYAKGAGKRRMTFNVGRLGKAWFNFDGKISESALDLILHELGHEICSDHLDSKYNDALSMLGAKAALLAVSNPKIVTGEDLYV